MDISPPDASVTRGVPGQPAGFAKQLGDLERLVAGIRRFALSVLAAAGGE